MLLVRALGWICVAGMLQAELAAQIAPDNRTPYGGPGWSTRPNSAAIPAAILEYYHALGWLKSYASKLEAALGKRLPETREALQQIQEDAAFLQQKWLDWPRRHSRQVAYPVQTKLDRYLRTIQKASRQLNDLRGAGDQEIRDTVSAIAADVRAKAENCRHSADGLGKDIRVTVRTKNGVEEIPGFEVWCAAKALVKFNDEHIRFPKISSPTTMASLAPGFYAMWLQKGKVKSPIIAQIIGGHGETELEIDLPIPAEANAAR